MYMPFSLGPECGPWIIDSGVQETGIPSLDSLAIAQAVDMRDPVSSRPGKILFSHEGQFLDAGSYLALGIKRFKAR